MMNVKDQLKKMRSMEEEYLKIAHPTKLHRAKTKDLLLSLGTLSKKTKKDVWDDLEEIDSAIWGTQITATKLKAAFRSFLDGPQQGRCCYCRIWFVNTAYARPIEHILPRAKYPQYSLCFWNLAIACTDCNGEKSDDVWGNIVKSKRNYPRPDSFKEFFHARHHEYNDHVRYVIVETNDSFVSIYRGITDQGRHLCLSLLDTIAARRMVFSSNSELRRSKKTLDSYKNRTGAIPMPELEAFERMLNKKVSKLIT